MTMMKPTETLILRDECYRIVGACIEVHRQKGCGLSEPVYQECLEIELTLQGLPFQAQCPLPLTYKGQPLRHRFQPDFICFNKVILEIKAVARLGDEHRSQMLSYLSATGMRLGLLVNFGSPGELEWERIVK